MVCGMMQGAVRRVDMMSINALTEQYRIDRKNLESDNGTSSMFIFNSFGPYASINMERAVVGQIIRVMK